jgi:hypothetical protein
MAKISNLGGQQPQQQQVNIKPEDLQAVMCSCGGELYLPSFKFKKVNKLLTGSQDDQIIPVEVFVCAACGEVLQELLPKEMRDN